MFKKVTKKKLALALLFLLFIFQFFRIDKTILPVNPNTDFISLTHAGNEVASVLRTACYDCHSNQSNYPWYTTIAPVSWWIKHHINEGSHHLNFSDWGNYTQKRKNHKLKECIELVDAGEMPMTSYIIMHKEARLNEAQKKLLTDWFIDVKGK